jgi:hypothetical protein
MLPLSEKSPKKEMCFNLVAKIRVFILKFYGVVEGKIWCDFPNDFRIYTKEKKISNFGESIFCHQVAKNFQKEKNIGRVSIFLKYVM